MITNRALELIRKSGSRELLDLYLQFIEPLPEITYKTDYIFWLPIGKTVLLDGKPVSHTYAMNVLQDALFNKQILTMKMDLILATLPTKQEKSIGLNTRSKRNKNRKKTTKMTGKIK